jgi:hypothetical protein
LSSAVPLHRSGRTLGPQWAGGRPRRIGDDDEAFIVATATTRPAKFGRPFTRWSLRKLADYRATDADRRVVVGRERLRQLLRDNQVSWQRTRTWKESKDPDFDAKLDRIEEVTTKSPQRCLGRARRCVTGHRLPVGRLRRSGWRSVTSIISEEPMARMAAYQAV